MATCTRSIFQVQIAATTLAASTRECSHLARRPCGSSASARLAVPLRRIFTPRSISRRLPPPPSDRPPPPTDPAGAVAYLLRLAPFVVRRLQRLGVPNRDVEDVAQQVLIVALRKWQSFMSPPDVLESLARRRWVFAITWHCALAYRRSGARNMILLLQPDDPRLDPNDHGAPDTDRRIDASRALEALTGPRLETSPERWRVFLAFEVDGMPLHAIARLEGLPLGTVASRLRSARRDLQEALARWAVQHRRRGE